ncbi:MAG: class I adenylate cyclase, partial [bacterium]
KKSGQDSLGGGSLLDDHPDRFLLDGYLIMFKRILDYYDRKGREDLQEILRKCFYLKVGDTIAGLSDPARTKNKKKDMLGHLVEQWSWDNENILDLNAYKEWPFDKNVTLGKQVNSFIIEAYKRLSQTGAMNEVEINSTDLTVLGRKLFTFYSKKENKIGFLPKSFEDSLDQTEITFRYVFNPKRREGLWQAFRGSISVSEVKAAQAKGQLLRQSYRLPELLLWLVMNRIWSRSTRIGLVSKESPVTTTELQDLLQAMITFFPHIDVAHLSNEDLLNESRTEKALAILNLGGAKEEGRIERLELITATSWGEFFYERPPKEVNQVQAIGYCLSRLPKGKLSEIFKVYTPSGKAGPSKRQLYLDFERIVLELDDFFHGTPMAPNTVRTHVIQGDKAVLAFTWNGEKIGFSEHHNFEDFFFKRERGALHQMELRVGSSPTKLLLPQAISPHLKPDVVQVFSYDDNVKVRVYVSDDLGGTTMISIPRKEWPLFGVKLFVFLSNIVVRIACEPRGGKTPQVPPELIFYSVEVKGSERDRFKVLDVTEQYLQKSGSKQAVSESLAVFEEKTPEGKNDLIFLLDGEEFSSIQHGAEVFSALAAHLYNARKYKAKYAVLLTDLILPEAFRQKNCPQGPKAIHYLRYKAMLERKLNEALQAL